MTAELFKTQEVSNETSELTNELTESDEEPENLVPATEIKLSFSPTKLTECFVKTSDEKKQSNAFEQKQREADEQFRAA